MEADAITRNQEILITIDILGVQPSSWLLRRALNGTHAHLSIRHPSERDT